MFLINEKTIFKKFLSENTIFFLLITLCVSFIIMVIQSVNNLDFVLEDGHPNQVGPGKRPYHTIIPGFITRNNQPFMGFGVMGGHMQAQGHLQMMLRVAHFKQNPQAASDAPRWYVFEDGRVALEDGFDPDVARDLQARGHDIVTGSPEYLFGGAQLIVKLEDGYCAGSDHRKEGLASGY